jgi:hypothetical protein
MAYEFKTLGSVEALTEVPENANALVEVDGAIKRVPGGALGGNGDAWDIVITQTFEGPDGIPVFRFAKGDHNLLFNMLIEGQVPRLCIYVNEGDMEHPDIVVEIPSSMYLYEGSSGLWIGIYGRSHRWSTQTDYRLTVFMFDGSIDGYLVET